MNIKKMKRADIKHWFEVRLLYVPCSNKQAKEFMSFFKDKAIPTKIPAHELHSEIIEKLSKQIPIEMDKCMKIWINDNPDTVIKLKKLDDDALKKEIKDIASRSETIYYVRSELKENINRTFYDIDFKDISNQIKNQTYFNFPDKWHITADELFVAIYLNAYWGYNPSFRDSSIASLFKLIKNTPI